MRINSPTLITQDSHKCPKTTKLKEHMPELEDNPLDLVPDSNTVLLLQLLAWLVVHKEDLVL